MKIIFLSKRFKFIVKFLVTLGFSAWVILSVDWGEVIDNISRIKWWQIALYVTVLLFGMLISSYKWKLIAEHKGIGLTLFHFFKLYIAGTFINNFTPSFIGGDAYKAYEIGRKDKKYAEAASTVVFDRITGLLGATMLAIFFSLLNLERILENRVLLAVNVVILLSLFVDILIVVVKRFSFWEKFQRHLPEKIIHFIRELNGYEISSPIFGKSVLLSFAFGIVGIALANYILFRAVGIDIAIMDYLSVIFIISIISSVPISINNIGIKEWAYISFLGAFGASSSPVIAVAILSRILQMIVSFFALPVYLKGKIKIPKEIN